MNLILKTHPIIDLNFTHAKGCYVYDQHGKEYLDFESGSWSLALGHCHPEINGTIALQIDKVMHLGVPFPNATTHKAANELLSLLDKKHGKCTFLSSGSEAVELAITLGRHVTQNRKCLTFESSYHSAYASMVERPSSDWVVVDWRALSSKPLQEALDTIAFEEIGVFAFEPGGSGSESVSFPPKELVEAIVAEVQSHGGVVVANEITTGFGRLGSWFGYEHYGITPDIVAMGKCLGNGYPVSAVVVNREIADQIEDIDYHHAQSHQNDPLGCAVATEVIRVIKENKLIERGREMGTYFLQKLKELEKYDCVKEARGRGMLLALEFHENQGVEVAEVYQSLLASGFIVAGAASRNFLRFDPPLIIQKESIDLLINELERIISAISVSPKLGRD